MRRIRDDDVGDAAGRELCRSLAKPGTGETHVAFIWYVAMAVRVLCWFDVKVSLRRLL